MPDLFGVDIAGEIASAFSGQLRTGTLTKVTAGVRTPGNLTGGTNPTTADYTFEGFIDTGTQQRRQGLATVKGQYLSILGGSVSVVPEVDDLAILDGVTYTLVELEEEDPAAALYKFRVEA